MFGRDWSVMKGILRDEHSTLSSLNLIIFTKSYYIQGIFLKIHFSHSVKISYKGCMFVPDRSMLQGSLHGKQSSLSALSLSCNLISAVGGNGLQKLYVCS